MLRLGGRTRRRRRHRSRETQGGLAGPSQSTPPQFLATNLRERGTMHG